MALVRLSQVPSERVEWLWLSRIPLGKVTVLDGDPGLGKTTMLLDLAGRVSQPGAVMPDGTECPHGGVVIMTAEDGLGDTIRPRCEVAGADLDRILALTGIGEGEEERPIELPRDLDALEAAIVEVDAKLVIVDPLMAFLGGDVNAHRDQDVRRALAQLMQLAERTGAAIVLIRHLNKAAGGNPLYRGGGSIGIIGAARAGLLVAQDPEDEDLRVLAPTKANLAKAAPSLQFRIEDAAGTARVVWEGESVHSAGGLLEAPGPGDQARKFLREILADGPRLGTEVKAAADKEGIAPQTLRLAREKLGIRPQKQRKKGGTWTWSLPNLTHKPPIDILNNLDNLEDVQDVQGDQPKGLGHLQVLGEVV